MAHPAPLRIKTERCIEHRRDVDLGLLEANDASDDRTRVGATCDQTSTVQQMHRVTDTSCRRRRTPLQPKPIGEREADSRRTRDNDRYRAERLEIAPPLW